MTPETNRRPLSPARLQKGRRGPARYGPSQLTLQMESHSRDDLASESEESLLAATHSRGVQTDAIGLAPSPLPRQLGDLSHDGHSETSSYDTQSSVVGVIVERISQLLNRLIQADALTLTNRLKRQRLLGADVSHLSRITVGGILNEANTLRGQFRAFLEDDKVVTTCTRKDLRALFKLFKDMFTEMGQLRVTLNDVILDPTVAGRVSEIALHPSKTGADGGDALSSAPSATPAWIAPLSKLLGLPGAPPADEAATRALSPPARPLSRGGRPPTRVAPKREAALSASAMTVNVEFSGAGVGRAVASAAAEPAPIVPTASSSNQLSTVSSESSRSVMNIFAGAPRVSPTSDPWVMVPKHQGDTMGARRIDLSGNATIGRSALRRSTVAPSMSASSSHGLSRVVDAVIDSQTSPIIQDDETRDIVPSTLLERTLRRRGLSDTSIHTTYMDHAAEENHDPHGESPETSQQDKPSVFRTLSRKMQNFRFASASFAAAPRPVGPILTTGDPGDSPRPRPPVSGQKGPHSQSHHGSSKAEGSTERSGSLFPQLGLSWAATALPPEVTRLDPEEGHHPPPTFFIGRPRDEEAALGHAWARGQEH